MSTSVQNTVMKERCITEENIQKLVDNFYAKVRMDEMLGPIFFQAIGEDLDAWKPHLQKMYDFWSTLMLGSRRYTGNPFQKHLALPAFDRVLFDRWLTLFEETARQLYTEESANAYVEKSTRIADNLKFGLYPTTRKAKDENITA